MLFAIKPRGPGARVGFRKIREGWPLQEGEAFTVELNAAPEDKVLNAAGTGLRKENNGDRTARAAREKNAAADAAVDRDGPEDLTALLLREILIDLAALKGITPGAYRTELKQRIKAR